MIINDNLTKQARSNYDDTVILIRTHYINETVLGLIEKLKTATNYRIAIVADERTNNLDPGPNAEKISLNFTVFREFGLYVEDNTMWKCGDYSLYPALFSFADAAYFWLIEPDVKIHTERLSDFFSFFDAHREVDFLACWYEASNPSWSWHSTMTPYAAKIYKCMFPITRFSRAAAEFMLERRRSLSISHAEAIAGNNAAANLPWPNDEVFTATELSNNNFVCRNVNDFGKIFYTEKTFDYFNPISLKRLESTLPDGLIYHPVLSREHYLQKLVNLLNGYIYNFTSVAYFIRTYGTDDYVQQLHEECGDEAANQYINAIISLLAELKENITIVIARYNEDIRWSNGYPRIIYNKGKEIEGLPEDEQIMLPNVGRESHTYLTYIIDNYDKLPEYVMFCQGRIDDHVGALGINSYINPDYDFVVNRLWYGKEWDDSTGRLIHHSAWQEMLEQGKLRKASLSYVDWFKKVLNAALDRGTLYSPGAIFFVSSKLIRKRHVGFYKKLRSYLEDHVNPEEGHYMKRSWFYIFTLRSGNNVKILDISASNS